MEIPTDSLRPVTRTPTAPQTSEADQRLREVARSFEAVFLSEMLKHAGLGGIQGPFGSGNGGDQFASLLRDAQSREIAANGGLGLAEYIFNSLKERQDAQ